MFDDELKERVAELVQHSIQVEKRILDWIFNKGEIETVSKKNLENYMKFRANDSLKKTGFTPQFNVTEEEHRPMVWFEEQDIANSLTDFLAKRPVDYTNNK